MKIILEEIMLLALIMVSWMSLPQTFQEINLENRLLHISIEDVQEVEIQMDDFSQSWQQPQEGWLLTEGHAQDVFGVLWELSKLKIGLSEVASVPVATMIRYRDSLGWHDIKLGRRMMGKQVPIQISGRWYQAHADIWYRVNQLKRDSQPN